MKPIKKHKKHDSTPVEETTKKKKKDKEEDTGVAMDDFVMSTDVGTMMSEAESGGDLIRYDTFIVKDGDNVFMVLPGTKSTDGKTIVSRMIHGLKTPCARSKRADRFDNCAMCADWFEHRSTKEERDAGKGTAHDDLRPKDIGVTQLVNITWACEHEMVRGDGDKKVSVLASTDIDMKRVKKCPCFLDLKVLDPESDTCKKCNAFQSCFQGPAFLSMSSPRVKDMLTEQKRIGGKKTITINGNKIALKGNIAMAWHAIHGDKEVAKLVSFPFIYTKSRDPNKDKRFGTTYKATFSRNAFVMPIAWQKNALARARDLGKFLLPITKSESIKALNLFLKTAEGDKKMACFDDKEIKDTEHCIGDGCAHYDECCVKGKKKHDKEDKKNGKKNKGGTKQEKAIRDMSSDDDDSVDDVISRMNAALDED